MHEPFDARFYCVTQGCRGPHVSQKLFRSRVQQASNTLSTCVDLTARFLLGQRWYLGRDCMHTNYYATRPRYQLSSAILTTNLRSVPR